MEIGSVQPIELIVKKEKADTRLLFESRMSA